MALKSRRVYQILDRIKGVEPLKNFGESAFTSIVRNKKIEPWHLEILGSVEEPKKQEELAKLMVEAELSGREAEVAKETIEKGLLLKKPLRLLRLSSENINRLQQTPVTLSRSIVEELKLRFGFKNDGELRSALHRAYNVEKGKIKGVTKENENLLKRFSKIFELEPIKFESFALENVYYLDFPCGLLRWLTEASFQRVRS